MSKIIAVTPNEDYSISIEFEHGNKILFDMKSLIKTIPFSSLNDIEHFREIRFDEKAVYWQNDTNTLIPQKLTVDNILFTLRD